MKEKPLFDLRDKCSFEDCQKRDFVYVRYQPLFCKEHYEIDKMNKTVRKEARKWLKSNKDLPIDK